MGFLELFEIGFFTALWNWSNQFLTILEYVFIVVGAVIQLILLKKCRNPVSRWSLIGFCGIGIVISECAWQVITGWDRLAIDIIDGIIVCILIGAAITAAVSMIRKKREDMKKTIFGSALMICGMIAG